VVVLTQGGIIINMEKDCDNNKDYCTCGKLHVEHKERVCNCKCCREERAAKNKE
jgi:hypothetical protein|tara:strand:- start:112 stop:273 length:162 start_codon:yes stop_codon:yes gene_type:complete